MALPASRSSWIARVMRESLESVASPELSAAILEIALHHARLRTIPDDAIRATRFVAGPLRKGVEQILGIGAAESIVATLTDLLDRAGDSGEHRAVMQSGPVPVGTRERLETPTIPAPAL